MTHALNDPEQMDGHLQELLADLNDTEIEELSALAEAMHAEGEAGQP
jgi:hypothetical protein